MHLCARIDVQLCVLGIDVLITFVPRQENRVRMRVTHFYRKEAEAKSGFLSVARNPARADVA